MDKTTFRSARPLARLQEGRADWYRIENLSAGGADVFIYDEIGFLGVTANDFVRDLNTVSGPINLHLNSPGGEVFDGIAIYNALKNRGNVTVYVDSLAASIASVIAMAGTKIVMAKHSTFMIHDAFGMTVGNAEDMRSMADRLEATSDTIASVYQERAGGLTKTWRNRMKAETWYSADEAVAAGLADEVAKSPPKVTNSLLTFDLSVFKHTPKNLLEPTEEVEDEPEPVVEEPVVEPVVEETPMTNKATLPKSVQDAVKNAAKLGLLKNVGTVTGQMSAALSETLTDMAQDWLSEGTINVDQFMPLLALISEVVKALDSGLDGIGISDQELEETVGGCRYCGMTMSAEDRYCPNCGSYLSYAKADASKDIRMSMARVIKNSTETEGCGVFIVEGESKAAYGCPSPVAFAFTSKNKAGLTVAVCADHASIYDSDDTWEVVEVKQEEPLGDPAEEPVTNQLDPELNEDPASDEDDEEVDIVAFLRQVAATEEGDSN